jgi:hypothetical protein
VIGSASPWVEAILFASGANNMTTIEYGTIVSHVPNHRTFTAPDFEKIYLTDPIQFDFVVSTSSLEHSRLGRYGDSLNHRGDVDASEEVYCMLKPDGLFIRLLSLRISFERLPPLFLSELAIKYSSTAAAKPKSQLVC